MIIRFFLKVFSLSFVLIALFWLFFGTSYIYLYKLGLVQPSSHLELPRAAAVEALLSDTNFLLLGISGPPYPAPNLTDTIIVGQFRVNPARVTLTSIPRDVMVALPGSNTLVKINSLYATGMKHHPQEPITLMKQKVEQISGLAIDYYAIIDVSGLEKVIDAFGGVDVEVNKAINDPAYPGPNYSYEPFYLAAGKHHLNGHDAVRFARSRASRRGDFDRIERQQQLLDILKQKAIAQSLSLEKGVELYHSIQGHLVSNVGIGDLPFLLASLFHFKGSNITSTTLDNAGGGLLQSSRSTGGAYILLPRAGLEQYSEIAQFFAQQGAITPP